MRRVVYTQTYFDRSQSGDRIAWGGDWTWLDRGNYDDDFTGLEDELKHMCMMLDAVWNDNEEVLQASLPIGHAYPGSKPDGGRVYCLYTMGYDTARRRSAA